MVCGFVPYTAYVEIGMWIAPCYVDYSINTMPVITNPSNRSLYRNNAIVALIPMWIDANINTIMNGMDIRK